MFECKTLITVTVAEQPYSENVSRVPVSIKNEENENL